MEDEGEADDSDLLGLSLDGRTNRRRREKEGRKEERLKEERGQGGDAFGLSVCLPGGVIDLGFL